MALPQHQSHWPGPACRWELSPNSVQTQGAEGARRWDNMHSARTGLRVVQTSPGSGEAGSVPVTTFLATVRPAGWERGSGRPPILPWALLSPFLYTAPFCLWHKRKKPKQFVIKNSNPKRSRENSVKDLLSSSLRFNNYRDVAHRFSSLSPPTPWRQF